MNIDSNINKRMSLYSQKIDWAIRGIIDGVLYSKKCKVVNGIEKIWGNKMIGQTNNNQWTTTLGETLVQDTLVRCGAKVYKPRNINGYLPDLETDKYIYEVKTRNWTTSGTAGEKVLGVPYKYSDIPRLYNKPLRIVCVAFQEYELTEGNIKIFGECSQEKRLLLDFWKGMNIEFVKFSDIVNGVFKDDL